jgi:hypothetical protein
MCIVIYKLLELFTEEISCEFGSAKYYALCGFGGILSCGITHTAVVIMLKVYNCCNKLSH